MNNNFEIVIIMSCYKNDRLDFLQQSLNSLYNQTNLNFDIFFGVDGEINNDTKDYLKQLVKEKNNFFLYSFKNNRGLSPTLNSLLNKSINKYKYFVRMDSDDICEPNRIQEQYLFLKNNEHVDIVGSNAHEINNEGNVFKYTIYPENHLEILKRFSTRNPMVHSAVMIKKSFFDKAGFYPETYHKSRSTALPVEDSLMWLQGVTNNCVFHNIQKPLLKIRYDVELFNRRGGFFNAYQEFKVNYKIIISLKSNKFNHLLNIAIFIIRIQPIFIRVILWRLLR